jgi:hypothetical protein
MTEDDAAARKARAERLRREIAQLIGEDNQKEAPADPQATAGDEQRGSNTSPSPREFIHRRMQELEKAKKPRKGKR